MTDYNTILETQKPRGKVAKALWKDVRNTSWSGQAIARNVHGRFGRRWTDREDTELVVAFEECQKAVGTAYSLSNKEQRRSIINALAIKMKRSPASLLIRLGFLGHGEALKRGSKPPSQQDLVDLITSSQAQEVQQGSSLAGAPTAQEHAPDALDALLSEVFVTPRAL